MAAWWRRCSRQAYACGRANLAAGLDNRDDSRRGARSRRRVGFASEHRAVPSGAFGTGAIGVEPHRHPVTSPVLGTLNTREHTRKLAGRGRS